MFLSHPKMGTMAVPIGSMGRFRYMYLHEMGLNLWCFRFGKSSDFCPLWIFYLVGLSAEGVKSSEKSQVCKNFQLWTFATANQPLVADILGVGNSAVTGGSPWKWSVATILSKLVKISPGEHIQLIRGRNGDLAVFRHQSIPQVSPKSEIVWLWSRKPSAQNLVPATNKWWKQKQSGRWSAFWAFTQSLMKISEGTNIFCVAVAKHLVFFSFVSSFGLVYLYLQLLTWKRGLLLDAQSADFFNPSGNFHNSISLYFDPQGFANGLRSKIVKPSPLSLHCCCISNSLAARLGIGIFSLWPKWMFLWNIGCVKHGSMIQNAAVKRI